MMNKLIAALGICLLVALTGAAAKDNADEYASLAQEIDALVASTHPRVFNGVILITHNDQPIYQLAQGYANAQTKVPLTLNDSFRIQSNSKQITAVLVLQQVEAGKLALSAPVTRYLPELKAPWANSVTLHQLLNMTSGITDLRSPLAFPPGSEYRYSNPAYGLLGHILEVVTDSSFAELADQLFRKLDMKHTYAYALDGNQALVDGHVLDGKQMTPFDFEQHGFSQDSWRRFLPAGGIISNVYDLYQWDRALHNGRVLSEASYQAMTAYNIQARHAAFDNQLTGYGYGVRIDDVSVAKHLGHAGRGLGFASLKIYFPQLDLSVIMLENLYDQELQWVYYFETELRKLVLASDLVGGNDSK